jgi:hypothetical protein
MKPYAVLLVVLFLLLSCGGGGGSDSSTDGSSQSETTFKLPIRTLSVGYSEVWDISGTVTSTRDRSDMADVSGSVQIEVLDIEYYQGERAYPVEQLVSLSIDGTPVATEIDTFYFDMNGNPISVVNETGGTEKTPITINHCPEYAEIGDFGQLTSWSYSDGREEHRTWRLEGAGGDKAIFIETRTVKNRYGRVLLYVVVEYKIATNGNILSQTRTVNDYDNDVEIDLVYTKR